MMENNHRINALRTVYKRRLLSTVITATVHLVATVLLLLHLLRLKSVPPPAFFIAVCFGILLTVSCYFAERAIYRTGFSSRFAFYLMLLLPLIVLAILLFRKVIPIVDGLWGFAYAPTMILLRPLIPLIQLLRDGILLRKGTPGRSVGRMKKNTHPAQSMSAAHEWYVQFEDEVTHKKHLIRLESMSPIRRYRIWYLPHSGLAVGEIIPEKVTFDAAGNPVKRKQALMNATKAPMIYDDHPDAHTPKRQKAAKFGRVSKAFYFLYVTLFNLPVLAFAILQIWSILLFVPLLLLSLGANILYSVFRDKELKLRCTSCTTARCVDITYHKFSHRHHRVSYNRPVVEYTVDGVTYTKELSIRCDFFDIGKQYTVFYDPLEPEVARAEKE